MRTVVDDEGVSRFANHVVCCSTIAASRFLSPSRSP
jgi:hypothetical protein